MSASKPSLSPLQGGPYYRPYHESHVPTAEEDAIRIAHVLPGLSLIII